MIFRSCLTSVPSLRPRTTTMWKCGDPRRKCQGGAREASGVDLLWSYMNKLRLLCAFFSSKVEAEQGEEGGWRCQWADFPISQGRPGASKDRNTAMICIGTISKTPNISTSHENISLVHIWPHGPSYHSSFELQNSNSNLRNICSLIDFV